ncbi:MAG TPA: outer membrane beta-barrel protein [Thermoanaerobaculia bacterium]|nr:outer membrane beta-barrel protein [Thermoanaerobaculia bacterium]
MKKLLPLAAALLAFTLPATAQNWSLGVGSGPFFFGDFEERRIRVGTPEGGGDPVTLTLSGATRAGALVDLERAFADRWAVRLEGSFTHSELSIRDESSDDGIHLDAGDLDVTTLALPLVFRINPNGAFRIHLHGGPAMAMYRVSADDEDGEATETSNEWGVLYGAGVAWWLSDRLAIEANASDITTSSPFEEDDELPGVTTKRPHNVHTTLGVRWRF